MAEVRPIRHETDFRVVPQLYHNDKAAFGQIMLGDAGAFRFASASGNGTVGAFLP